MKVEENKTELPTSSIELVNKLDYWKISYKLYFHKPLMTVKESKTMQKKIFGLDKSNGHIKNLFLRDKKKNNILLVAHQDTLIDLKLLAKIINMDRLSFGSPER